VFQKRLIELLLITGFAFSAATAQVVIGTVPPQVQVKGRMARPGPDYVWVPRYQRWDGETYGWSPGRWERPPRPGSRWVKPRYPRQGDGWNFFERRWR